MRSLSFLVLMVAIMATSCHRLQPCLTADAYTKQLAAEANHTQPNKPADLIAKDWACGGPAFLNLNQEKMELSEPEEMGFGHHVIFNANGTIHGSYSAQCGNDCFTSVYGTYKMTDTDVMQVHLDSVTTNGYCGSNPGITKNTEIINKSYAYSLQKQATGYVLTLKK